MRKKLHALAISIPFILFSPLIHAYSCELDVAEMRDQISQYGSIRTLENDQINSIDSVSGRDYCTAKGYNSERPPRQLTWQMHNWGNTLHSYPLN